MKLRTTAMALISLAAILSWSSAPALAQRGHGGGGGANPGGGMGAAGTHGAIQSGIPGSVPGQGQHRPDIEHPSTDHPQGRPEARTGGRPDDTHNAGRRSASERLADNPKLSGKLNDLFPAGTNLQQQAAGFKNLGEFVSAAHVSHNLGIPFEQLRTRIAGGQSLGDAIHELKPDVDRKAEAKKAREQARKDLRESEP